MCTVVATPTLVSLDDHFIKRPSATFFVIVEGGIALTLTLAVAQALGVWAVKNLMIHRLQHLLCPAAFTQQIHVQTISKRRIQCMGKCECRRLKGNPCGPLRPNTINVTMPGADLLAHDVCRFVRCPT